MIRTVLFDLDGTLTDSREGIVNSVKYAIEKLGGTMPDQQTLLKFIGPPLQESFMAYCGYDTETAAWAWRFSGSGTSRWASMKTSPRRVCGSCLRG